jgi:hypothetical protein
MLNEALAKSPSRARSRRMVDIDGLRKMIRDLVEKHGGWRELDRASGVNYQTLQNWAA